MGPLWLLRPTHDQAAKEEDLCPHINASVWLKDANRFALLKNLEHTPRPGEILKVEGERWRVVEWTDRIECEAGGWRLRPGGGVTVAEAGVGSQAT